MPSLPLRGLRRSAAVLSLALAAAPSLGAQGGGRLPDTPAGQRAAALLATINQTDEASVRAFVQEHMGEGFREMPMEEHLRQFDRMRRELAGAEVVGVRMGSPEAIQLVLRPRQGEPRRISLEVAPEPPHPIVGVSVAPAGGPGGGEPALSFGSWEELDRGLRAETEAGRFSGVVLASRGGEPVFHRAYGLADREARTPNRPDTRFNLGSIDKGFTAVAILRLAQDGRIGLDDPVGKYLRGVAPEVADRVTIRQLLQHRSGLGDYLDHPEFTADRSRFQSVGDYLALARAAPLEFEPGTRNRYSNLGFVVLGGIVEAVTGRSYYDVVEEVVFRPAGMRTANSFGRRPGQENTAVGYTGAGAAELAPNTARRAPRGSPAGGGYASAEDLMRFVDALIRDRLLDRAHTDLFLNRFRPLEEPLRRQGTFGLGGGAPGLNAAWEVNLDTGEIVVVLANLDPPAAERLSAPVLRQMRRL